MKDFVTIERGVIAGKPYFVARRLRDGWTRCFWGVGHRRRTMQWLKKQKKIEAERDQDLSLKRFRSNHE